MNLFQAAVANFRAAIEPVVRIARDDTFWGGALAEVLDLPAGTTVPALISASDITAIEVFLGKSDPDLEEFVEVAKHVIAVTNALHTFLENVPTIDSGQVFDRAISILTVFWLKRHQPLLYAALRTLQVIETDLGERWTESLHLDRLGKLLRDIHGYLASVLKLANDLEAKVTSDLVFLPIAGAAAYLQDQLGASTRRPLVPLYGWDSPPSPSAFGERVAARTLAFALGALDQSRGIDLSFRIALALVPGEDGGPGLMLAFEGDPIEVPLGDEWTLKASLPSQLGLWWIFGKAIEVVDSAGSTVSVDVLRDDDETPSQSSLPLTGGTRLEVGDVAFHLQADSRDIDVRFTAKRLALVVGTGSIDSFIGSGAPRDGLRAEADLTVGISAQKGVYIGATAGLSTRFDVNRDLGPLHIDALTLEVRSDTAGSGIALTSSLSLSIKAGPVVATVEGIGAAARITFPATNANLGVLDFQDRKSVV